jgi:hypothetical protein
LLQLATNGTLAGSFPGVRCASFASKRTRSMLEAFEHPCLWLPEELDERVVGFAGSG